MPGAKVAPCDAVLNSMGRCVARLRDSFAKREMHNVRHELLLFKELAMILVTMEVPTVAVPSVQAKFDDLKGQVVEVMYQIEREQVMARQLELVLGREGIERLKTHLNSLLNDSQK